MKILFHFTIALLVLSLVACNQTKGTEPVKANIHLSAARKEIR